MSPVHEHASTSPETRPALTPRAGMTRAQHGFLDSFRKEFFDLVDGIVQSSSVLLADARDKDHPQFTKDLTTIHAFGERLHEMAQEFFDLGSPEDPALQEVEKT